MLIAHWQGQSSPKISAFYLLSKAAEKLILFITVSDGLMSYKVDSLQRCFIYYRYTKQKAV